MSKVIEHRNGYTGVLNTVVECNRMYYIVDSRSTTDNGFETTVFESDDYKQVVNWTEVFTKTHDVFLSEIVNEHASICENLERNKKMITFKDLMILNHPEKLDDDYNFGCPYHYKYEREGESIINCTINDGQGCDYCWNREIPTNKLTVMESDYYAQLQAIEKKYDCLHDFIQSKGLDEEYEKWLKRKKNSRYVKKPQLRDAYWFIDSDGDLYCNDWICIDEDEYRWLHMPLWKTDKDALRYKEVQNFIKSKVKPFVQGENNYCLKYNNNKQRVEYTIFIKTQFPFVDYFNSEKDCQEIINTIGVDDLLKYYFLIEG